MSKVLKARTQTRSSSSRRSLRRINKLLDKNLSQYEIPNPYRSYRSHPCLPQGLSRQLSQLDYLSIRSLQNLHFQQPFLDQEMNQLLLKMKCAVKTQSQQFHIYLGMIAERTKKHLEAEQEQSEKCHSLKIVEDVPQSEQLRHENSFEDQLQEQSLQGNLPLVMHHSEAASMMSDNYEADKLTFQMNKHFLGNQRIENQENLEPYQL